MKDEKCYLGCEIFIYFFTKFFEFFKFSNFLSFRRNRISRLGNSRKGEERKSAKIYRLNESQIMKRIAGRTFGIL